MWMILILLNDTGGIGEIDSNDHVTLEISEQDVHNLKKCFAWHSSDGVYCQKSITVRVFILGLTAYSSQMSFFNYSNSDVQ